eukprot:gene26219-biopygen15006
MSRGECLQPESSWNRSCQSRASRGIGVSGKRMEGTSQGVGRVGGGCIRRNVTWGGCIWHLPGSRNLKWVTNLRVSNTQTPGDPQLAPNHHRYH